MPTTLPGMLRTCLGLRLFGHTARASLAILRMQSPLSSTLTIPAFFIPRWIRQDSWLVEPLNFRLELERPGQTRSLLPESRHVLAATDSTVLTTGLLLS